MTITVSEAVVCAIIGLAGALIGAAFSLTASIHIQKKESQRNREMMAHEIEKMQLSWNREDTVADNQDMKELGRVMGEYLGGDGFDYRVDAMQAIGRFRATANRADSAIAQELYQAVSSQDVKHASRIWETLLKSHNST